MRKGAKVVPVASIEKAGLYPEADYRIGERGSARVRRFDFGNSPSGIEAAGLAPGAVVVLSTTNGTRVLEAAHGAPAILAGAFVKAHAVADALATGVLGDRVGVVGCGWQGRRASEDESAAGAIFHRLREHGASLDERAERVVSLYLSRPENNLRNNSAAQRLMRLGYEQDIDFCLAENTVLVVPRLSDGAFTDRMW